jgi:hypothetical protein
MAIPKHQGQYGWLKDFSSPPRKVCVAIRIGNDEIPLRMLKDGGTFNSIDIDWETNRILIAIFTASWFNLNTGERFISEKDARAVPLGESAVYAHMQYYLINLKTGEVEETLPSYKKDIGNGLSLRRHYVLVHGTDSLVAVVCEGPFDDHYEQVDSYQMYVCDKKGEVLSNLSPKRNVEPIILYVRASKNAILEIAYDKLYVYQQHPN